MVATTFGHKRHRIMFLFMFFRALLLILILILAKLVHKYKWVVVSFHGLLIKESHSLIMIILFSKRVTIIFLGDDNDSGANTGSGLAMVIVGGTGRKENFQWSTASTPIPWLTSFTISFVYQSKPEENEQT